MTSLERLWMSLPVEERRSAVGDAARRIGVPDIRERTAWEALDREAVAAVLGEAEKDRAQPWPHTLLSDYARYWRDGVRVAYEEPVGELRRRTSAAVAAAAITGDESWLDHAADGLQLLCEQTTWCWAAKPGATGLPRSTWLPDTQVFVARDPGAGLTLAAKGGHNDENHNHNDVG